MPESRIWIDLKMTPKARSTTRHHPQWPLQRGIEMRKALGSLGSFVEILEWVYTPTQHIGHRSQRKGGMQEFNNNGMAIIAQSTTPRQSHMAICESFFFWWENVWVISGWNQGLGYCTASLDSNSLWTAEYHRSWSLHSTWSPQRRFHLVDPSTQKGYLMLPDSSCLFPLFKYVKVWGFLLIRFTTMNPIFSHSKARPHVCHPARQADSHGRAEGQGLHSSCWEDAAALGRYPTSQSEWNPSSLGRLGGGSWVSGRSLLSFSFWMAMFLLAIQSDRSFHEGHLFL